MPLPRSSSPTITLASRGGGAGRRLLADIAVVRAEPGLLARWHPTRWYPGWWRGWPGCPAALRAIRSARSAARQRAWALAGDAAPGADGGLIPVDIDATIVIAYSDKNQAAPTWKKSFGFHPLAVFADHGPDGSGEPLKPAHAIASGNRPKLTKDRG